MAEDSRRLAKGAVINAASGNFNGSKEALLQIVRRVIKGKVRFFLLYDDFFLENYSAEELTEEGRKGPLRLSPKNKVKTEPERALRVTGGV